MFKLSKRSKDNLIGVNPRLVEVVNLAIDLTFTDFGVIEGLRSKDRQTELFITGASKTMHSRHLTGDAVDLLAYVDGAGTWEVSDYFAVADAMQEASIQVDVPIRWGAAWHVQCIGDSPFDAKDMYEDYIDLCKAQSRQPFVDAVHFELNYR